MITVGNAKIAGLERDLGMSGYDYNLLLSVFYISYVSVLCEDVAFFPADISSYCRQIAFELPAAMFTKW